MLSIQINTMMMLLSEFDFFDNLQGQFSRFANLVLLLLLFTDDIALISDTIGGLRKQIQILLQYCHDYKMVVNVKKQKLWYLEGEVTYPKKEMVL